MADLTELSISGRVATPGDPDWDEARQAWNLVADQRPAAVAFVESAEDVAAVLRFAEAHELKVAVQGTGHGAATLGPLEDALVIKTARMRGLQIDASTSSARVEAGVLAHELGAAAQRSALCSLPGSAPDVGVIGYTLGGGLSWLGRRYGFACNRVRAIELVTADADIKSVDADSEPELFWALRGGGGGYAVVTALHIELLPVTELYAGALIWPAELGAEAIRLHRDWSEQVSENVTSIVRFLRPPPLPDVPEPLRDRPLAVIDAACIGTQADGEATVAPLRALGEPIMDTFAQIPAEQLSRVHMDPETPVPGLAHHALLRELPEEAIDAFVAVAGPDSGSPLLLSELRHLGGALARESERPGALSKLDAEFLMFGTGVPMAPGADVAIEGHLDTLHAAMQPWSGAGGYLNFAERPCGLDAILPAATCARLGEIKRYWDPSGMILANHALA